MACRGFCGPVLDTPHMILEAMEEEEEEEEEEGGGGGEDNRSSQARYTIVSII